MKSPKLTFDGMYISGSVTLSAWAGYGFQNRSRRAPKVLIESEVPEAVLDELDEGVDPALTPAQQKTLEELVARQVSTRDAVLASIFAAYSGLRKRYLPHIEDPRLMPELSDPAGLRSLVNLKSIYLHRIEHRGRAYFGLILGCPWDDEHDLGIMMQGSRVIDVGGGDTAILEWIAKGDLRARGQSKKKPAAKKKPTAAKKKPTAAKKKPTAAKKKPAAAQKKRATAKKKQVAAKKKSS